jgi:heme-degrading monooxygenase HmoA
MFVTVTRAEFIPERFEHAREEIARLAGAMTKLAGYRGTETLRDVDDPFVYLFLLRWENEQAWRDYRETLYKREVVTRFEPLTRSFRSLGHYELLES